ncbi:helix-turn-helix transcriptional regulator [Pseudomonas sp. NFX224]|uniref:helix-turn-helix transcriptional regulator n=1 Tax=Pseudomonas sp. NFX224 TaxID=3402862 RepID=UPI003AFA8246
MSKQHSPYPCRRVAPGDEIDTSPAQLTAKETQTLMWCLKGKTSWEIARIQNCSVSTVNFHFANIRRKFAVSSRSAALLKAIESGAICVTPDDSRGVYGPD